ncbi:hypothetical protein PG995_005206 [Apiospora arundinis]
MAHQAHALPWNTLASHFQYTYSFRHHPQRKDIFARGKANQTKEIDYFCRTFAARIQEFAKTERAKYSPHEEHLKCAQKSPQKVYPDEIKIRYFPGPEDENDDDRVNSRFRGHFWGGAKLQCIDSWFADIYGNRSDYAETLKIMIMEAAGTPPAITGSSDEDQADLKKRVMESMLTLANHPKTDILGLINLHHGHHFGLSRVAEEGIRAYVYLNLLVAMQENGSNINEYSCGDDGVQHRQRQYMGLLSYERMLHSVAGTYDGDAQNLVHWDFFYPLTEDSWEYDKPKDVLADIAALQEYLKGVWRVLVVYDLVIREAGGDPALEIECRAALNNFF